MSSAGTRKAGALKAELVVIGAGGAGLAAAVTAAERGAKDIILLEARRVPGGNSVFPDSFFAIRSGLPKRSGVHDGRDELFKKAISYAHWKTNPRILRALFEKAEDMIAWLEGKGLKIETDKLMHPDQVHVTARTIRGASSTSRGRLSTGAAVVKALVKDCEGAGARIICQTRAKKLFVTEKGKVAGVVAEAKDGQVRITAKGFIIATGGFSGNKDMLKKHFPFYNSSEFRRLGLPQGGDGLRMAAEIGAGADKMTVLEMAGPDFQGPMCLQMIGKRPQTIWVNRKGDRFTDETVGLVFPEGANSLCGQPGKISYTLFDENIKQTFFNEDIDPRYQRALSGREWTAGVNKDLQLQASKGMVKISDSCDDIATWMGVAPEVLKATINEYNNACDQGYDHAFAKDPKYLLPLRTPPYYALPCRPVVIVTHGGIMVNRRMEVLDQLGNPIPGLYAAGVDTGGTDSDTYNFHLRGHSFGFSLNSGRIAGENAANYIRGGNKTID